MQYECILFMKEYFRMNISKNKSGLEMISELITFTLGGVSLIITINPQFAHVYTIYRFANTDIRKLPIQKNHKYLR